MASYTEHLELLKKDPVADGADTFNIQTMLNDNWDKIDDAVAGKADLGEDGKIPASQLPEMNYDPAGSAAAVQENLAAHMADKNNPHGVTPAQIGAQTALGFTPVQQGGGANQLSNKVKIGWTGTTLDLTVDNSNMGSFLLSGTAKSALLPPSRGGTGVGSIAELASLLAGQGLTKIQTLTYTGTGTFGQSAPNMLTFSFPPKFVIISNGEDTDGAGKSEAVLVVLNKLKSDGVSMADSGFTNVGVRMGWLKSTWVGNSVTWYLYRANYSDDYDSGDQGGPRFQANTQRTTYAVCAFG